MMYLSNILYDKMITDHQVGKDKAASVTGEDVVATELLCLPEAL